MRERKEIYSYRKFKGIGLASAMIGLAFFGLAADTVNAGSAASNAVHSSADNAVLSDRGGGCC